MIRPTSKQSWSNMINFKFDPIRQISSGKWCENSIWKAFREGCLTPCENCLKTVKTEKDAIKLKNVKVRTYYEERMSGALKNAILCHRVLHLILLDNHLHKHYLYSFLIACTCAQYLKWDLIWMIFEISMLLHRIRRNEHKNEETQTLMTISGENCDYFCLFLENLDFIWIIINGHNWHEMTENNKGQYK